MVNASYVARYAHFILKNLGGPAGYQQFVNEHGGAEFIELWDHAHIASPRGSVPPIPGAVNLGPEVKRRAEFDRMDVASKNKFFREGGRVVD